MCTYICMHRHISSHLPIYIYIYVNDVSLKVYPEIQNLFKDTADHVLSFEMKLKSLKVVLQ